MRQVYKTGFILAVACVGLLAAYYMPPLAQDPEYHNFVDQRTLYGVTNFWNVASNALFVLFGFLGLFATTRVQTDVKIIPLQRIYSIFFTGAILIGIGSSYYHLNPSNHTLVWDRLPMTVSFMALFSLILAEYVSRSTGKLLFLPLLAVGMISVIYWHQTETIGAGDLRLYAVIQFLPMIIIPAILLLYRTDDKPAKYLWMLLAFYLFSKLAEYYDARLYEFSGMISGHSLKHVFASFGILFFYYHFRTQMTQAHDK